MSLKTEVLLTLICACVPTFAMADIPDYSNDHLPKDLAAFHACIEYPAIIDEEGFVLDESNHITTTTNWEKDSEYVCTIWGTEIDDLDDDKYIDGHCEPIDKSNSIYQKYENHTYILDNYIISVPAPDGNNMVYRCKIPGYELNDAGVYVKRARPEVTRIPSKFDDIDNILSENDIFKKSSAWIDKDGNFNTARLVSDSVAGVVLGTVGGIVSAKVIKKNQLENGLQDLKCTIGGQDVATYGDEISIVVK